MNFEQYDNFLLADWVLPVSPLSAEGTKEIAQLEEFCRFACEQAAKERVQAVLWLQKVPSLDATKSWLDELTSDLLRDQLRSRMLRLHKLTRLIRSSPIPWIYATEKDCLGTQFELMQACHKRFVFDRETWFGFPEFAVGQVSALGWLGAQLHAQPGLAKTWRTRSILSAEEAVQSGIVNAALTWKDWRRNLPAWMQQQISVIEADGFKRREMSNHPSWTSSLWPSTEFSRVAKSHIESYQQLATQAIPMKTVDRDLIDTASHFMMQPTYEFWVKQEVARREQWGRQSIPGLIYFDITESLPPMTTISHLLDHGVRIILFAPDAQVVTRGVETLFSYLNSRYTRPEVQQFHGRITWFVGPALANPEAYTMKFGAFREFTFLYKSAKVEGWAMATPKSERQTVEIYGDTYAKVLRPITDVFDGVYLLRKAEAARPILFQIRSLALQMLIYYGQDSGTPWNEALEQLSGIGWTLLGSERFWKRFLDFRAAHKELTEDQAPLGRFGFEGAILRLSKFSDVVKLAAKRRPHELERGPGYLHRMLVSFAHLLVHELHRLECFESLDFADLYVSDALGFPRSLGTPLIYARRLGLVRMPEARYAMEIRSFDQNTHQA